MGFMKSISIGSECVLSKLRDPRYHRGQEPQDHPGLGCRRQVRNLLLEWSAVSFDDDETFEQNVDWANDVGLGGETSTGRPSCHGQCHTGEVTHSINPQAFPLSRLIPHSSLVSVKPRFVSLCPPPGRPNECTWSGPLTLPLRLSWLRHTANTRNRGADKPSSPGQCIPSSPPTLPASFQSP